MSSSLYKLKKHLIICALSNGSCRLLVDQVCTYAYLLTWPFNSLCASSRPKLAIFLGMSSFLQTCSIALSRKGAFYFRSYAFSVVLFRDRDPKVYAGAAAHLSLPPSSIAMIASHICDLRAAAGVGFRTVYIPRETEDTATERREVNIKTLGGEIDVILGSFTELAEVVQGLKQV